MSTCPAPVLVRWGLFIRETLMQQNFAVKIKDKYVDSQPAKKAKTAVVPCAVVLMFVLCFLLRMEIVNFGIKVDCSSCLVELDIENHDE